jgi:hypothetical protein
MKGRPRHTIKSMSVATETRSVPETRRPAGGRVSRNIVAIRGGRLSRPDEPRIFVAMPFAKEMRDVFFGIQQAAVSAGLVCNRLDQEPFTGDVVVQIKRQIDRAALVIADISGANPNVMLEVGYAWGKHRPTLLLLKRHRDHVRNVTLPFDVSGHKCILYEDITDLHQQLTDELQCFFSTKP